MAKTKTPSKAEQKAAAEDLKKIQDLAAEEQRKIDAKLAEEAEAEKDAQAEREAEASSSGLAEVPLESEEAPLIERAEDTSDRNVIVYSKLGIDMKYDTPYGEITLKGVNSMKTTVANAEWGVTNGVSVNIWNYLVKIYGKTEAYRRHIIHASQNAARIQEHAAELSGLRTGLEPLDRNKTKVGLGVELRTD